MAERNSFRKGSGGRWLGKKEKRGSVEGLFSNPSTLHTIPIYYEETKLSEFA